MKRKTSQIPSKVYTYGCLPPRNPEHAALIGEQLWLAHRYRNKLVEIELARRATARQAQAERPEVIALETRAKDLADRLAALRTAIKSARKSARSREAAVTAPAGEEAKVVLAELRAARAELKAAKVAARADAGVAATLKAANDTAAAAVRAARAECGVYWGTYLLAERAMEQARGSSTDPKFQRYRGEGRIGVQLQGGLPIANLPTDTRLQIDPVPPETWTGNRGQRRRLGRTLVRIRVGSTPDGRAPVWVELPMVLHRPLPADGIIKWAWLKRVREGTRWRYDLQITVEAASFVAPAPPGRATAAIDMGWRLRPGGDIRVGYLADERGHTEELVLPANVPGALDHVESLRAIRDRNFNVARDKLGQWLALLPAPPPQWLGEATQNLVQWRSPARLSAVAWAWREQRFDGDAEIFAELDAWRKQDRHLLQWESHERAKTLRRRRDIYRNIAHRIATKYGRVVLEKFDLRQVARLPAPEGATPGNPAARGQRQVAAISELRQCITSACAARGVEVVTVDGAYTTRACHACGVVRKWDAATNVTHACDACGAVWDQDDNAARNLLAVASGAVLHPPAGSLAESSPTE